MTPVRGHSRSCHSAFIRVIRGGLIVAVVLVATACREKEKPAPPPSGQDLMRQLESNDPQARTDAARELGKLYGQENKP